MDVQCRLISNGASSQFCLESELCQHAWFPHMTAQEAEQVLKGKPTYTYLLRKSQRNLRKYDISFVNANGKVQHDTFTLVNPKLGIFLNGHGSHLGKLAKVVRDMMHCEKHQGSPFTR